MSASRLAKLTRNLRRAFRRPIAGYRDYQAVFAGKSGIEIGGPSKIFRRDLPIYRVVKSLDGVNFSAWTVWEGSLTEGRVFRYTKSQIGRQFIGEGSDLKSLKNFENRCLHHHVFDTALIARMFDHVDMDVVLENAIPTDYIVLGRKR